MFRTSLPWTDVVNSGDSLLMLPTGVARVDLQITGGPDQIHIICHGNSRAALAKVEMRVSAAGFQEARRFTHDIILPVLSWWSFRWTEAREYNPDFVAIDRDDTHWVVEVKMDKEMQSAEVQRKRDAARRWANYVSGDEKVGACWRYLLVSETDVKNAKDSWEALKGLGGEGPERRATP